MAPTSASITVALAQMNPTVGDIRGNAAKIAELTTRGREAGASLIVFPELALTGYPPEDLLLKTHFLDAAAAALDELAARTRGIVALVGFPRARRRRVQRGRRACRRARSPASTARCTCRTTASSTSSATSSPGTSPAVVEVDGVRVGLTICEDIWEPGPPAEQRGARRGAS